MDGIVTDYQQTAIYIFALATPRSYAAPGTHLQCAPPLLALLLTSGQSRVTHDERSQYICPSATHRQPLASTFTHIGGFPFRPPPNKHNILLLFYSGLRANAGIIAHPTLWAAYCHANCRYYAQLSKLNIPGIFQLYGQTTKPARTTAV